MDDGAKSYSEDFNFYGGDGDEHTKTEIKGITDKVTEFAFTDLSYPCVILRPEFTCQKHQINVLKNMVKSVGGLKDIGLFFLKGNELFKMGSISGLQVGYMLDLFGTEKLFGYMDNSTKLEGSKLYTLETVV